MVRVGMCPRAQSPIGSQQVPIFITAPPGQICYAFFNLVAFLTGGGVEGITHLIYNENYLRKEIKLKWWGGAPNHSDFHPSSMELEQYV